MLTTVNAPRIQVAGPERASGWSVDALLLGVVEAWVRADFLHRAKQAALDVDFYESSAQARWTEGEKEASFLDVAIQPRIGVQRPADVPRAEALFNQVASGLSFASSLRVPLTIRPTVELWTARPLSGGGGSVQHE